MTTYPLTLSKAAINTYIKSCQSQASIARIMYDEEINRCKVETTGRLSDRELDYLTFILMSDKPCCKIEIYEFQQSGRLYAG